MYVSSESTLAELDSSEVYAYQHSRGCLETRFLLSKTITRRFRIIAFGDAQPDDDSDVQFFACVHAADELVAQIPHSWVQESQWCG